MTRYELVSPGTPGTPLDLGVFLVTVDGPEDRAALAAFRRRGWAVSWLRSRHDPRARLARLWRLSASALRAELDAQAARELNTIGRALCLACEQRTRRPASRYCTPCGAALDGLLPPERPGPTT